MPQTQTNASKREHISCRYVSVLYHYFEFCIGCFRVLWCCDRSPGLAGASEQECRVPHGLMAVSYTHLDVYKRQGLRSQHHKTLKHCIQKFKIVVQYTSISTTDMFPFRRIGLCLGHWFVFNSKVSTSQLQDLEYIDFLPPPNSISSL